MAEFVPCLQGMIRLPRDTLIILLTKLFIRVAVGNAIFTYTTHRNRAKNTPTMAFSSPGFLTPISFYFLFKLGWISPQETAIVMSLCGEATSKRVEFLTVVLACHTVEVFLEAGLATVCITRKAL